FYARVHPDDLAKLQSVSDVATRSHQPFDTQFRIVRPSGEIRWIASKGQAYCDDNGHAVRVVANNIDITERMQAEEALREREQRLRLALDASGGGSWSWDAGTGRVDWDDRFRKLYGFAPEQPPFADAWQSRVHQDDRPLVLGVVEDILRSPM